MQTPAIERTEGQGGAFSLNVTTKTLKPAKDISGIAQLRLHLAPSAPSVTW